MTGVQTCALPILFDKPEKQIDALQKIMGVIQDQDTLKKALNASNVDEVVDIFN